MVTPSNREVLSVSDLTRSARQLLEGQFPMVYVEGEISNFSRPASGHWYLTLKDDKSQLRCAMFRNRNQVLRFTPKNGLQVILRGKISLYEGRGEFQMIAEFMEEAGDGALRQAFERLKAQLQEEGLFEASRKRALPSMPTHLGIITSPTGAAVRDVLHVLKRRFPALRVSILPVPVQGDEAVGKIEAAIHFANQYTQDNTDDPMDVLLLTRGGGSLEDLWAFNTEPVARAVANSQIPIVCAVGHETDFCIAEFAADLRAPTPSAAAEMISPDSSEWSRQVQALERKLVQIISQQHKHLDTRLNFYRRQLRHPGERLGDLHQRIDDLEARLQQNFRRYLSGFNIEAIQVRLSSAINRRLERLGYQTSLLQGKLVSPTDRIRKHQTQLLYVQQQLEQRMHRSLSDAAHQLNAADGKLQAHSPVSVLKRGYAIVTDTAGRIIRDAKSLKAGETIHTQLGEGRFSADVKEIEVTKLKEEPS